MKTKASLLFICLGNICRSPAAEGIMRSVVANRHLDSFVQLDSAGIGLWHVGQLPDRRMRNCAARHGYELTHHARQFSARDFDRFDYIVVMDEENRHDVLRQARTTEDHKKVVLMADYLIHHPGQQSIPDPYYGSERDFEWVIELLEDACEGLLDWVVNLAPASSPTAAD